MISKKAAALGAVVLILVTAFFSSYITLNVSQFIDIKNGNRIITGQEFQRLQSYYKLDAVRSVLERDFYQDIDSDELITGAIKGMVEAVGDPYTTYFTPEEYKEFFVHIQGSYVGVGLLVTIDETDNLITVTNPFRDAPAAKAGIIAGDKIIRIDGKEVNSENYEEAVKMMKDGEPGSKVVLTILRNGEVKDYEVERAPVELPNLESRMLENNIGYIWLYNFDQNAAKSFEAAVNELMDQGMEGLILDLRGNPGGLLEVCEKIADMLLPEGLIVYSMDKNGNKEEYRSDAEYLNIPLVLLIDRYSASASEVLSGAIQDYGVGTLIGETTFGKGLVQAPRYFEDGSVLKLTIRKYYTPKGRDINTVGVVPDIEVKMTEEAKEFLTNNPGKDLPQELDAPLVKGIEVIKEKLEARTE